MAKIYVSSTYLDLQEFREKILFHLHRLQQAVGAMEYYLADDRRPADKCVADVKTCDNYVGIFAWRYGTVPETDNPDKLSITEMEYRAAREKGIPCLIFLHDGKSPWSPDLVDDDKTRIKAFRKKAESEQSAQWFKTADELASLVGASLYDKLIALGYGAKTPQVTTFDLESYYTALRKRYGVLALEGLTPPQKEEYLQIQLRSVFVEQSVRENPPPVELPKEVWEKLSRDKEIHPDDLPSGITLDDVRRAREAYYEKPSRPVLDVLTDSRYQHAIILGDPGSGKSTLARYVMLSLIDVAGDEKLRREFDGHLPLLIELRSYIGMCAEGNCNNFLEFLEYLGETEGFHLTKAALHNHLKNDGRAVVIFDGLDEIFEPDKREQITRQIVGFCNDYPKAHVIVTSRVIGYRRKILTDAGFTHFTLQDLDEKQVATFVKRWYDLAMSDRPDEAQERRERILKSFKESASIRQLAGNPMLLTIMAIIGKHQELPRERWKLYDHAASVLIQHWDVNKHLKDARIDADFIGEDDKKELLRRLAFRMQSGDGGLAGNYIHRDQLQAEFDGYLRERYAQTPNRAKVIAEAMIQQFRERNFILSLYGANLYGFVHRAFLEYFCASAFVWKFEKTKEFDTEQLKTEVYGKHWEDQSWHEVLRLICGMIEEKWAGEIIDYLAQSLNDEHSIRSLSNNLRLESIALALQCLSELRNLSIVEKAAGQLLKIVCAIHDIDERTDEDGVLVGWQYQDFFREFVLPSVKSIGSAWPNREWLIYWLQNRNAFDYYSDDYEEVFGQFIGCIGRNHDGIHEALLSYSKNSHWSFRLLALFALENGWTNDPKTVDVLTDCIVGDDSAAILGSAVVIIARTFPDSLAQILPVLIERAVQDSDSAIRRTAISALIENYRQNERTLPLLIDRATKDESPEAYDAKELWETPSLYPREVAINAIAKYWPTHPDTLPLLHERAENDPTPWLRERAKELADEIEGKSKKE